MSEDKQELEYRPWGYYIVLARQSVFKVKRTVVHPGLRLSLQRHHHRAEHWYIVQGRARVTLGERTFELVPGQSIDIPCENLHRIENCGAEDVIFIEIQTGDYFGEDDIERLEDDCGRAPWLVYW
jgi:mannose-6-phosphate isomerase-like protein (cupin superfamily)